MPFVVKATYRNETRRISFADSHFPRFDELYQQLYRVYSIGQSYFLSKLLFSPGGTGRILIGVEAHSAEEYNIHCAPFLGRFYPNGILTFSVLDETPHKIPQPTLPGAFIHTAPPVSPMPPFTLLPPPPPPPLPPMPPVHMEGIEHNAWRPFMYGNIFPATQATTKGSTACCSVAEGKQEVKNMIDTFLQDLQRVVGSTFSGDERSFFDPLDTPTMKQHSMPRATSPLPPISLDASLHIPGSFMQPRPQTPEGMDVEKSQSPPQVESSQMLHPGIWCDFCGKQIRGLRFKCQECPHYDLCANCIVVNQALDKHNADKTHIHRFNTFNPPSQKDLTPREIITALGPRENTPQTVIHRDVICDKCNETVVGARFKCLNCPDFDLCDKCVSLVEHPNYSSFHTIAVPDINSISKSTPPEQVATSAESPRRPLPHGARCNLCDSRIVGARYKCTDCPDFDTCSECFVITAEQHPGHSFAQLNKPTDFTMRKTSSRMYHFATCDGCHSHIIGVRYKCMHPDCPDYDLCQNCEALPIGIHPDTHSFLKIRSGSAPIPVVQRNKHQSEAKKVVVPTVSEAAAQTQAVDATTPVQTSTPVQTPTPLQTSDAALMQEVKEVPTESSTTSSSPSSPIERLHAIRDQAAQKAQALDQEIEELEKARRRKHDEDLKQSSRHFVETLKSFLTQEVHDLPIESPPNASKPASPSSVTITKEVPEMTQKPNPFFTHFQPVFSLNASFVSDNNIPDGHIFPAGAEFVKSWRVKNVNSESWSEGTEIVFVGGHRLGSSRNVPMKYIVGAAHPGEEIDVFAKDMKAPETPGRYMSHWSLRDAQGKHFGPRVSNYVVLEADSGSSHYNSLANSEIVVPGAAPAQTAPGVVNATPVPSSPVTAPSTIATLTDDASDVSSIRSVSVIDHMDSDWDEVPDAPQAQQPPAGRPRRAGNAEEGYQVLYDSASDEA
ncbi:hypothetical protein BU17DRAFT_59289 [Hysterangium stoloniferum]|nr:hypothetical protein BU17DRAFT_59289 [Hysterangium stoloniferum]